MQPPHVPHAHGTASAQPGAVPQAAAPAATLHVQGAAETLWEPRR